MRAAALNSQPSSSKEGFTLVEVIISMTLMAMVFTAAFGSYSLGMRLIEDAREEVRAAQIIQSELERLRTKNWQQITEMADDPVTYFEPQGTFVKQYSSEYTAYRVLRLFTNGKQMSVIVVVQWTNSKGRLTRQLFNTVITQDGLNDYYYRDI